MGEFLDFVRVGFRHIITLGGMDHILFLLALAAIYTVRQWRDVLKVVTAFTVGHSITLAAAALGHFPLGQETVEFLIPLTIIATCLENMYAVRRPSGNPVRGYRVVFALIFGLVHGAGFGGYLGNLFGSSVSVPLAGFNVGIELAQVTVLAVVFLVFWLHEQIQHSSAPRRILQYRTLSVSALVLVVATGWAVERAPW